MKPRHVVYLGCSRLLTPAAGYWLVSRGMGYLVSLLKYLLSLALRRYFNDINVSKFHSRYVLLLSTCVLN